MNDMDWLLIITLFTFECQLYLNDIECEFYLNDIEC